MGDIGGAAQAGANVVDTAANDATQVAVAGMNDATQLAVTGIQDKFNDTQAQKARNFNAQQALLANQFSASQAQKNRDFQMSSQLQAQGYNTEMSDTAMQRRMSDLKAAGLNPALSMGALGGASTPTSGALGGSSAQGIAMGGPSASSAGVPQLGATSAALNSIAQRALDRQLITAQARKANADATGQEAVNPYAGAQAAANVDKTKQDIQTLVANANALGSQYDINEANVRNLDQDRGFRAQMQPLLVELNRLAIQAQTYGLAQQSALADVYNSPLGRYLIAGGLGHQAGGDLGGAAAIASWKLYNSPLKPPTRSAMDVGISDPNSGFLEDSGIGAPTP